MRWTAFVTRMWEKRNACAVLDGKPIRHSPIK